MNKLHITLYLLLVNFTAVYLQDDITINDVEVVKAFDAKLIEAKKIPISPVIPDTNIPAPNYNYDVNIIPLDLTYPDPIIRPLAMKPDPRNEPKMAWLKGGFGTLVRPYLDLGYNIFIEDLYNASLFAHYEGGQQTMDEDIFRSYSDFSIDLEGAYFLLPKMSVYSHIGFNKRNRSLGTTDSLYQSFSSFFVGGGIKNPEALNDKLFYNIGLDFHLNKEQAEDITETIITLPANIAYEFSDMGLFSVSNTLEFSKALDTYDAGVVNQLNASIKNTRGAFSYALGGDVIQGSDQRSIFPSVLLSYAIMDNKVNVELGSDQSYYRYNIEGLFNANPYFLFSESNDEINISRNIFLGANGKISNLSFSGRGGYKLLSNIYSFVKNDSAAITFTNSNNENNKSTAVYLEGNLLYEWQDWLSISGNISQHFYNSDIELYHLPSLEARTKLIITGNKSKWHFYSTLQFTDKVTALNITDQTTLDLNNQIDFSLGGDYFIIENLGLYLEANNLFSNNYERWQGYKDFGSNFYGGIKLKF